MFLRSCGPESCGPPVFLRGFSLQAPGRRCGDITVLAVIFYPICLTTEMHRRPRHRGELKNLLVTSAGAGRPLYHRCLAPQVLPACKLCLSFPFIADNSGQLDFPIKSQRCSLKLWQWHRDLSVARRGPLLQRCRIREDGCGRGSEPWPGSCG